MRYLVCILLVISCSLQAETARLAKDTQAVKDAVLELNKDLFLLEQELLSPITTQIGFYLSLQAPKSFTPLSIELKAGSLPSFYHLYTERQVEALHMGAVQPLMRDNIGPGEHPVQVVVLGKDRSGNSREVRLTTTVNKESAPLLLEIVLTGSSSTDVQAELKPWK